MSSPTDRTVTPPSKERWVIAAIVTPMAVTALIIGFYFYWLKTGVGGGNDYYDGGAGTDTITFRQTWLGVAVDLDAPEWQGARGLEIGKDTVVNIENVVGGRGKDRIIGSAVANVLDGGPGNDELTGEGGDDVLIGGRGQDTAIFAGAFSEHRIVRLGSTAFAVSHDGETDRTEDVELFRFDDQTVDVTRLPTTPGF